MRKRALAGVALLGLMQPVLVAGCVGFGPVRTHSQRVELGGAQSARVELQMGVGALVINGGADELLEAVFTYNRESWKPEVGYTVRASEGLLTIKQPADSGTIGFPSVSYEWDLRFNSEVPLEMIIQLGVGGGDLRLGELNLGKLDVEVGVGGANIDLTGARYTDLEATIHGGVGGLDLTLPRDVGVRVEVESGLGGVDARGFHREGDVYTNEAYGRAGVTLDLKLEVGVGGVKLSLAD